MKIIILILFCLFVDKSFAETFGKETGLKIPRFVSTKSDSINLRVGPSLNYPILLKYIVNNLPLEIIEEHREWRKIIDYQKNSGWIHKSLLKGNRNGIIISENNNSVPLFNNPEGKEIGQIGINNIVAIKKCIISWCKIFVLEKNFWINKENIWGIYSEEKINYGYFIFLEKIKWKVDNFIDQSFNN